jgi:hypothetical protein
LVAVAVNNTNLLWFVALVGVSVVALALGYLVSWIFAVLFWIIATLILLAVRPY